MKRLFPALLLACSTVLAAPPKKEEVIDPNAPISYYKQVRPIFQGQCQGGTGVATVNWSTQRCPWMAY
jgi:hypothetical protein